MFYFFLHMFNDKNNKIVPMDSALQHEISEHKKMKLTINFDANIKNVIVLSDSINPLVDQVGNCFLGSKDLLFGHIYNLTINIFFHLPQNNTILVIENLILDNREVFATHSLLEFLNGISAGFNIKKHMVNGKDNPLFSSDANGCRKTKLDLTLRGFGDPVVSSLDIHVSDLKEMILIK